MLLSGKGNRQSHMHRCSTLENLTQDLSCSRELSLHGHVPFNRVFFILFLLKKLKKMMNFRKKIFPLKLCNRIEFFRFWNLDLLTDLEGVDFRFFFLISSLMFHMRRTFSKSLSGCTWHWKSKLARVAKTFISHRLLIFLTIFSALVRHSLRQRDSQAVGSIGMWVRFPQLAKKLWSQSIILRLNTFFHLSSYSNELFFSH